MNRASSKHSVLYSVRAKMHVRASAMLVRGPRRSLIITSRGIGREFSTPAGPLAKFLAATEPLVPRFLTDDKIDAACESPRPPYTHLLAQASNVSSFSSLCSFVHLTALPFVRVRLFSYLVPNN